MATRSRIAIELPDGTVKSIYCHWDGSPDTNGVTLMKHYQERKKVEDLIALGSLSILAKNIEPTEKHTFSNPQSDVVVAYHRDRGEAYRKPDSHRHREDYFMSAVECFGYLFTKEDKWVYVSYCDRRPRPIY